MSINSAQTLPYKTTHRVRVTSPYTVVLNQFNRIDTVVKPSLCNDNKKKDNALRHRSRDTWVLHSRDRKNNNPAALRSVGIVILSHEAVTVPSVPLNEGKFRPVIKTGLI